MNLVTILYLAELVEKLQAGLIVAMGLLAFGLFPAFVEGTAKEVRLVIISIIGCFLLYIVTPSKTVLISFAAVEYAERIIKNEKVVEVGDKLYKLLNQKLDTALEEGKK